MPPFRASVIIVTLALCCAPALADTETTCPQSLPRAPLTPAERAARTAADRDAPTQVWARHIQSEKNGVTELDGFAELIRGGNRISSDQLRYEQPSDTAEAKGNVQFRNTAGDGYYTEQFRLKLDTNLGEAGPSRYTVSHDLARGDAARIDFQGPGHTRLTDARYTTCRPGQDDWFLKIGRLDLDTDEGIGTAYHATVDFFGVPLFYFPYVNFPISDKRKSGFLFPRFGHSDKLGYEFSSPYYFNLAPNYDATVTPRVLTQHGLQLQNQFRYLTTDSGGKVELEILPHDRVTGDNRVTGSLQHQQTFNPLWSGKIDLRGVSDRDYFQDFGDRLSLTSQTNLPELMEAVYHGPSWTFATRLADNQTIDKTIAPEARPYGRLPQLQLASAALPVPNHWYPQLESEWNRFEHKVLLTGERLNLNTGLSLPLQNDWGFFTPKVGARYIGYHLDRDNDGSPALTRGVFSLDTGLFFERDSQWGNRALTQTLEPRLFYLRIPTKNQDALPNFDSGVPDLSFAGLFRENRFTGGDRIGDANQITTAVTTRFLDTDDGMERLRLSIGRIYYLDGILDVNLAPGTLNLLSTPNPPGGTQHRPNSDIVAEASAWLIGNWHARETLQWNTGNDRVEKSSFYLQYQPARSKIFNLGHVFVRDQIGQYDVSAEWPIAGRWALRARSLRSTRDDRNLETYAGVEYNACCWALRVLASRRWQDPQQVNAIMFEFQLTGLSKLGGVPDSPLKQGLFSFKDERKESLMNE